MNLAEPAIAPQPFDTVIVPDFSGAARTTYEARSLFFLASWIEYAGAVREFPLHVACIGEPPASVRRLAAACDATVTTHLSVHVNAAFHVNKFRGFEVPRRTNRLLLLDVDVLALSDLSDFGRLGDCIAAAPASMPQTPDRSWKRIYQALGVDPPTERIASMRGRLGLGSWPILTYAGQNRQLQSMFPMYNAGVVYTSWDNGLLDVWPEHVRIIPTLFSERARRWRPVHFSDQLGLATAVTALRRRGVEFKTLPLNLHTNWMLLYRHSLPVDEMKIYHAYRFCSAIDGPENIRAAIANYHRMMWLRMRTEAFLEHALRLRWSQRRQTLEVAGRNLDDLVARLERLYERHIAPALEPAPTVAVAAGVTDS